MQHIKILSFLLIIHWKSQELEVILLWCSQRSAVKILLGRLGLLWDHCRCKLHPLILHLMKMLRFLCSYSSKLLRHHLFWIFYHIVVLMHWNDASIDPNLMLKESITIESPPKGMITKGCIEIKIIWRTNSNFQFIFGPIISKNLPVMNPTCESCGSNNRSKHIRLFFQENQCSVIFKSHSCSIMDIIPFEVIIVWVWRDAVGWERLG